jgi:hypothetical protein
MRLLSIFSILFLHYIVLFGQIDSSKLVKYTTEFRFSDGLFVNFEQVKNNKPILKSKILSSVDMEADDFFNNILKEKVLYYFDAYGIKQDIKVNKIWGYSKNGSLFIRVGEDFSRISYIGSICHFIANVTTYDNRYYDPFYANSYYNRYGVSPNTSSSEMKQFIINLKTGEVLDFEVKNVEAFLMRDPTLYDEYIQLRSRKKDQLKFLYIRKFNERNPLYFPAN